MRKWSGFVKCQKIGRKALAISGIAGVLLTGCGSAAKGYSYEAAADTAAVASESYDSGGTGSGYLGDGVYFNTSEEKGTSELAEFDEELAAEESSGQAGAPEVRETNRKLIRNVNLEVETETFEDLLAKVKERTGQAGGYIEESYTYNGSSYKGNRLRNASLTIRIPAERLDEFLENVAEVSNVISRNESVTDVTLQYVDLESHKKALLAEQERLLELLSQAESMEDIVALEGRLSEVRYQLESMESQLRVLDNQVSYSTVYLSVEEVAVLTPVKEQSVWEKISTGFVNSLYEVGNGFADFSIGLLIDLPYIVVWIVLIVLAVLVLRLILRRIKKKNPKRNGDSAGHSMQGADRRSRFSRGGIFSGKNRGQEEESGKKETDSPQEK